MEDVKSSAILLESGTNEFEIVEFTVGNVHYGINVAKVREIIRPLPITKIPGMPPVIEGIIELRGRVISIINLGARLENADFDSKEQHVVICEFNNTYIGFLVNAVLRIHRISWEKMEPLPDAIDTKVATGIIKMDNKLIILLDFEQILTEVSPEIAQKLRQKPEASLDTIESRKTKKILLAEDSRMLRELLSQSLQESGYTNLLVFENGRDAWNTLERIAQNGRELTEDIHLVITDIEMPQMDGHHLLKRIKETPKLSVLPVIIFSSLINQEMRRKGEALGAISQITKPEIAELINQVDKFTL
ncbi:chemotaxis protein CheV [Sporomusaceae bacterium FL31]|nr:chemotaxis protein CheV [Sporomusaceae bacterium FL31]GCE34657.1 chemotaxis protein CheV [Sporomusaceae bacterium]